MKLNPIISKEELEEVINKDYWIVLVAYNNDVRKCVDWWSVRLEPVKIWSYMEDDAKAVLDSVKENEFKDDRAGYRYFEYIDMEEEEDELMMMSKY